MAGSFANQPSGAQMNQCYISMNRRGTNIKFYFWVIGHVMTPVTKFREIWTNFNFVGRNGLNLPAGVETLGANS